MTWKQRRIDWAPFFFPWFCTPYWEERVFPSRLQGSISPLRQPSTQCTCWILRLILRWHLRLMERETLSKILNKPTERWHWVRLKKYRKPYQKSKFLILGIVLDFRYWSVEIEGDSNWENVECLQSPGQSFDKDWFSSFADIESANQEMIPSGMEVCYFRETLSPNVESFQQCDGPPIQNRSWKNGQDLKIFLGLRGSPDVCNDRSKSLLYHAILELFSRPEPRWITRGTWHWLWNRMIPNWSGCSKENKTLFFF